MAALLKSAESKDFVGSNPTLSATAFAGLTALALGACARLRTWRSLLLAHLQRDRELPGAIRGHWAGRPAWAGTIGWLG